MPPGYLRRVGSLVRQPRWIAFGVITLVLCVAFWWLGLWQWHRHEERSSHNAAVQRAQQLDPVPLAHAMPDPAELPTGAEHRPVTASGVYSASGQVLQRNPGGRAGFQVVTPLQLEGGGSLIVNRGFIAPSTTDPNQPASEVQPPAGRVEVVVRLRAAEADGDRAAPAGQIYGIDPAHYPVTLPTPVHVAYGDLVAQDPSPPADLILPPVADLGSGPHLFYAIQWWSFIPLAIIGFILLMRREARDRIAAESGEPRRDTPRDPTDHDQLGVSRG